MRTLTATLSASFLAVGLWTVALAGQANMVQTHIGHVMDSFNGTPMSMGLLPTAMAEAKIAAQHAGFAAKATTLAMIQTHAGHVMNAIDPASTDKGPGLGYGLKKAAAGVAMHADLAGKAPEANAGVKMHAMHVNTAAMNVAAMSDEVLAIGQKIKASTSMDEALKLAADLQKKAEQLTAGVDANGDGTIGWNKPEGGLAQAQQHMELMKKAASGT